MGGILHYNGGADGGEGVPAGGSGDGQPAGGAADPVMPRYRVADMRSGQKRQL